VQECKKCAVNDNVGSLRILLWTLIFKHSSSTSVSTTHNDFPDKDMHVNFT